MLTGRTRTRQVRWSNNFRKSDRGAPLSLGFVNAGLGVMTLQSGGGHVTDHQTLFVLFVPTEFNTEIIDIICGESLAAVIMTNVAILVAYWADVSKPISALAESIYETRRACAVIKAKHGIKKIVIVGDLNIQLNHDGHFAGRGALGSDNVSNNNLERRAMLHSLMHDLSLRSALTFVDDNVNTNDLYTWQAWGSAALAATPQAECAAPAAPALASGAAPAADATMRTRKQLDHILIPRAWNCKTGVSNDERCRASDHFPVWAQITDKSAGTHVAAKKWRAAGWDPTDKQLQMYAESVPQAVTLPGESLCGGPVKQLGLI